MPDDLSPSNPNTARVLGVPLPGAADTVAPGPSGTLRWDDQSTP